MKSNSTRQKMATVEREHQENYRRHGTSGSSCSPPVICSVRRILSASLRVQFFRWLGASASVPGEAE